MIHSFGEFMIFAAASFVGTLIARFIYDILPHGQQSRIQFDPNMVTADCRRCSFHAESNKAEVVDSIMADHQAKSHPTIVNS